MVGMARWSRLSHYATLISLPELSEAFFSLKAMVVFPFAVSNCLTLFHRASTEHTSSKSSVTESGASALGTIRPAVTDFTSDLSETQAVSSTSHDLL